MNISCAHEEYYLGNKVNKSSLELFSLSRFFCTVSLFCTISYLACSESDNMNYFPQQKH